MNTDYKDIPASVLMTRIGLVLSKLGMNERYASFEYLNFIITYMIKYSDESDEAFDSACQMLMEKNSISMRAITNGVGKLMNSCTHEQILGKPYYLQQRYGIKNKIRMIKSFVLKCNLI
ncbi:MAG: hypothetical protein E7374_02025 [Clostridiales bacterium]|nr:hypothetical protein [Clostridiales bacterium]